MKRLLVAFAIASFSCAALPCKVSPMKLYRDHAALVGEATEIVLAEAIEGYASASGTCRFRSMRTLKGRVREEISVSCRSPVAGESTTHPSAHNTSVFWQQRRGRVTSDTDCQLQQPAFTTGHKYLLILGVAPDSKQFEEIVEPSDKWLLFVEQQLQRGEQ